MNPACSARLCMNERHRHAVSFTAHTEARMVFSASAASIYEYEHDLLNCSERHFMSILPFLLRKTIVISKATNRNVSGYYRNLGSLRAGMRPHGEFSVMGTSSLPTFPEVLLAHASQMTGQLSRSMHIACKY